MMIEKHLEDLSLVEIDITIAIIMNRFIVTVHSIENLHCCKVAADNLSNSFPFRPSSEYQDGGPVAEQYKAGVAWDEKKSAWVAYCNNNGRNHFVQHESMVAAQMLAIIKAYRGLSVNVPLLA